MEWKLSDAKNRLSELVNRVIDEGPQLIRRRNDAFVVLTEEAYKELAGERPSLKELLLEGPSLEGVDLSRNRSGMRDAGL